MKERLRQFGLYLLCLIVGVMIYHWPGPSLLLIAYFGLLKGIIYYATKPLEE